jgi:hypothetical protein
VVTATTANNENEKIAGPRRRGPGKPTDRSAGLRPGSFPIHAIEQGQETGAPVRGKNCPPRLAEGEGDAEPERGLQAASTSPGKATRERTETEGRAPMRVHGEDIKKFFEEDDRRFQQLLESLLERKPEILLYYLAGKPVEPVEHSGGVVAGLPEDILARARDYAQD